METPSLAPVPAPAARRRMPPPALAEALVGALLAAHKAGTLEGWLRRHRRIARWLQGHWLAPVLASGGDATRDGAGAAAVGLLLRWAVLQLRPDRAGEDVPVPREAWLDRTSWRPMLALWCQFGFGPVPAFRDRYRGHADEPAASHLCGLWSVGPSTYYRYLDKGKRGLAALLGDPPGPATARLALRGMARDQALARLGLDDVPQRQAWHRQRAGEALTRHDSASALWHLAQAGDQAGFAQALQRHSVELASEPETDALLEAMHAAAAGVRERCELLLAEASLWRMRGQAERELQACEQALREAAAGDDTLMLGVVYGELGKFHELRDMDRAFACYQDSADALLRSGVADDRAATDRVIEAYAVTLVRLAWLYVLRNDPRARPVLERAQQLCTRPGITLPTLAMLEQTWGECCRRSGDLPGAIEHRHRALLLYERVDDRQAILKTCGNLSLIYGEAKDYERAREYARRVLALADTMAVDPEILASTHLNLGVAHFWQGHYAEASAEYEQALEIALRAQLRRVAGVAHYNLAEVAYLRFKQTRDPADEQRGDRHAAAAVAVWPHESDPSHAESTNRLKRDILGPADDRSRDRLLSAEAVDHLPEMSEVARQRERLAVPAAPEEHVRARLAIANAYLAVAVKEREAALALIERHALGGRFADELDGLRRTFERQISREQRLAAAWRAATADLITNQRCQALLQHLLAEGTLNKSRYAELCGLSPATASKHLGLLAERGLLQQTGKGPSTRYTLPA